MVTLIGLYSVCLSVLLLNMELRKFPQLCTNQMISQKFISRFYRGSRFTKINKIYSNETGTTTDIHHKDKQLEKELEEKFKNSDQTHPHSDLDQWLEFPSDTLVYRDQLIEREKLNKMRDQASKAFRPKVCCVFSKKYSFKFHFINWL